jgi:hypothetical protein
MGRTRTRTAGITVIAGTVVVLGRREVPDPRHPEPDAYAAKFSGPYSHRTIEGASAITFPQEAAAAFSEAILDPVGRLP